MAAKPSGEPGWKWRRWLIFPSCVFFAYELDMIRQTTDVSVLRLLAYLHAGGFVAVIFMYAGFATIQDIIAIIKTGRGLPYKEEAPMVETKVEQRSITPLPPAPEGKIEGL